ncbi:MAG: potassium transporter TrkA [Bdellovibrio sp. CG12_big_fil_rev_8_21_14_0_65_39_13]|nr:MAG: potassium transporter TrkA [Bdellovibrio sp. CG22_combo_CG10-13_8_21_14_all_39_27]PIQ61962.1 MAG: potassium transporter TrkA [Bdellovibrio sp. CG12_big_fil_rev_8_21_14_0_65_39_13]PIR35158.1 MAG: potassium transporter TrkA [Bdellovibrio sp. CG11_big_fil_rev_8_21_14_0_20_39_38]PJB53565.1 MAG: potassium transporter TrkA [Bdellovibrio sp. CG_4_9_14_3_um_filter_39_7]
MQVAVIGLGTFGAKTAIRLHEKGAEVIAIDMDEDLVDKIKDRVTHAVSIDVTDERALRSINISDVDVAVVAIGVHIEQSILAVTMLRKLGVGRVIARATSAIHEHVLYEIGASEVIKVEEEMGEIVASKIIAPHVLQRYNFAAGYSIVELKLGKNFEGKTLVESKIRQNYSLNIVALQKRVPYIAEDGKPAFRVEINDCPMPMDVIEADDIVVLVGSEKNFNKLFADLQES